MPDLFWGEFFENAFSPKGAQKNSRNGGGMGVRGLNTP